MLFNQNDVKALKEHLGVIDFGFQYTDTMFVGELGPLQKLQTEFALQIAYDESVNLDFTTSSINDVEKVLSRIHLQYKSTGRDAGLNGYAMQFGCYIAAVIQKDTESGTLMYQQSELDEERFQPLYLEWEGCVLSVANWCRKRIFNGPEDNVLNKYIVAMNHKELLHDVIGDVTVEVNLPR